MDDVSLGTSDDDLARAMAAGDESALARAYDAHGPLVYALALRVTGRAPEAEEVLQDVFLSLWRSAEKFDRARGSLVGFLTTLARNRAIDRVRARRARPDSPAAADPADAPSAIATPLEAADRSDAATVARSALASLPPEERRVLEMAYFDGLSQTEI